jgi:hypothetical protein
MLVAHDHLEQLRLEERGSTAAQDVDFALVVVQTNDGISEFREARSGD